MKINSSMTFCEIVKYCLPENLDYDIAEKLAECAELAERVDNGDWEELQLLRTFFAGCVKAAHNLPTICGSSIYSDKDQQIIFDAIEKGSE